MTDICPKCGSIAKYRAYYGRMKCTHCNWESEKVSVHGFRLMIAKLKRLKRFKFRQGDLVIEVSKKSHRRFPWVAPSVGTIGKVVEKGVGAYRIEWPKGSLYNNWTDKDTQSWAYRGEIVILQTTDSIVTEDLQMRGKTE